MDMEQPINRTEQGVNPKIITGLAVWNSILTILVIILTYMVATSGPQSSSQAPSLPFRVDGSRVIFENYNVEIFSSDGSMTGNLLVGLGHDASKARNAFVAGMNNTVEGHSVSITAGLANFVGENYSSISGGWLNKIYTNTSAAWRGDKASHSTITGGYSNEVNGWLSVVSAGMFNKVTGFTSSVAGGHYNTAHEGHTTISGGLLNYANGHWASVAGGRENSAEGAGAIILGGHFNKIPLGYNNSYSVLGGGTRNKALGMFSSVVGGKDNTASGQSSVVSGGSGNKASGIGAVAEAGRNNEVTGFWGRDKVNGTLDCMGDEDSCIATMAGPICLNCPCYNTTEDTTNAGAFCHPPPDPVPEDSNKALADARAQILSQF